MSQSLPEGFLKSGKRCLKARDLGEAFQVLEGMATEGPEWP